MGNYKISKRLLSYDGMDITELVFNSTDADYFSLVPPEEVSEYQNPLIEYRCGKNCIPLEVRTVKGNYRNGLYYFTLVRFHPYFSKEFFIDSFGREIANLVGDYFGDVIYRYSDLNIHHENLFTFDSFRDRYFAIRNIDDIYIKCFSPSQGSQEYYYKAFTGTYTGIEKGCSCPFGNTIRDKSKVDHKKKIEIENKISELKAQIVNLPTEYTIPFRCTGDEWEKLWETQNDIEDKLKQKQKLLNRISRMKRQTTISYYQEEVDELTKEIEKNPLWPKYSELEENKKKNEAAEENNLKLTDEIYRLENELSHVESAEFTRLRQASHEECKDCPFYDFVASLQEKNTIVCKISSLGLRQKEKNNL